MSSLHLEPASYFTMCTPDGEVFECGIIHINTDKELNSPYLFSKKAAHQYLMIAFENNLVSYTERDIISQQIDESPLPRTNSFERQLLASLYNKMIDLEEAMQDGVEELDRIQDMQETSTELSEDEKKPTLH